MLSIRNILIFALLWGFSAQAQDLPAISQYMHASSLFNPAKSVSGPRLSATALYRNQWTGYDGAPITQMAHVNYKLFDMHGIGLTVINDKITVFQQTDIAINYGFKAKFNHDTYLGLGGSFSWHNQQNTLTTVDRVDIVDPQFSFATEGRNFINFGFGAYFSAKRYYFGLSVPRLFRNEQSDFSLEILQFKPLQSDWYLTTGYDFENSENLVISPLAMIKHKSGLPVQMDLGCQVLVNKSLWGYAGYNSQRSIIAALGYIVASQFKASYSYDFGLSTTRAYAPGSHEITLNYGIPYYADRFGKRIYLNRKGQFQN